MKPYVYLLGVTLVCEYSDFEKGLAWMGEGGEVYVTSYFCPQAVAQPKQNEEVILIYLPSFSSLPSLPSLPSLLLEL